MALLRSALLCALFMGSSAHPKRSLRGGTDTAYSISERINQMHETWCDEKPGGSICKMLEWKEQQRMAQDSGGVNGGNPRPRSDGTEIRAMHEW